MSLHLNGNKILGSELKVAATLSLAGEDMSGQGSKAAMAETGDKAKQLSVSLLIKQSEAEKLTALVVLAESKDNLGERTTYNVVNKTAQAMNLRQARFLGDLSVTEDDALKIWRVSFKLSEIKSVAEVKEARQADQPVDDLPVEGEAAIAAPSDLDRFENLLKWLDERIK